MARPFALPPPSPVPALGVRARLFGFLFRTWRGRVLLGAVALFWLAGLLGLPDALTNLSAIVLCVYLLVGIFRLARYVLSSLLWRIRTKLIVSYLFIALVPVLLLTLLFLLSSVLGVLFVAAHLVGEEMAEIGRGLTITSEVALAGLPSDDRAAAAAFEMRLGSTQKRHPGLGATLLRRGRVVAHWGEAPQVLPAWWKEADFAGLAGEARRGKARRTGEDEPPDVYRTVCVRGESVVIIDLPLDTALFAPLEERSGIHVLGKSEIGADDPKERSPLITVDDKGGKSVSLRLASTGGLHGVALPDRLDWATGERQTRPLPFRFEAFDLLRRLSPGIVERGVTKQENVAEILLIAVGAVGFIFLIMYAVALALGLMLARSITRSIHSLYRGTEQLRRGDFTTRIPVSSRDQLGELAFSFNHMAAGIEGLLHEQAEKDRLEEELRIARQIQMSLLPADRATQVPGLRIAALCLPAAEVGGDYYDLLPLSEDRLGVLVADVSGKGTSAALYMAELKGLVLSLSRIYDSPARLLREANLILAANMDSRSFITMTYAVVDVGRKKMRYARAGHNPLIHFEAGTGRTRILTPPGLGLGIDRGARFDQILQEDELDLRSGDVFLFFTDGLSEAMNGESELFGEGRLSRILTDSERLTSEEIREKILAEVRAFAGGAAQADDMTMVILKVA